MDVVGETRLYTRHMSLLVGQKAKALHTYGRTNRRTNGPTDGPTNGRTDRPSYRDARTHLKRKIAVRNSD